MYSLKTLLASLAVVACVNAAPQPSPIPCPATHTCPSAATYFNTVTLTDGTATLVSSVYGANEAAVCSYTTPDTNPVTYSCDYTDGNETGGTDISQGVVGCPAVMDQCNGFFLGRRKRSEKKRSVPGPAVTLTPELKARHLVRSMKPHAESAPNL